MPTAPRITRLAPSPTGALHLGNARTFLINWALARQNNWQILLRIEDLDTPRTKPNADQQAIADLQWLGLDWDHPPTWQRADLSPYHHALEKLRTANLIYPCTCTRTEIERAQSAPHADDHELRYPGTCRPKKLSSVQSPVSSAMNPPQPPASSFPDTGHWTLDSGQNPAAYRLIVPDTNITFTDKFSGPHSINVQQQIGDFIVATKSALPAYQLAVVVDDTRQQVTDVVRGDDLLPSTARQILLYRCLNLTPLPNYYHLPLVLGPDGRRLAKRHGDTRIAHFREQHVPADRIIGLIAHWSGITPTRTPISAQQFRDRFQIDKLPRNPVTFTPDDLQWLTSHAP